MAATYDQGLELARHDYPEVTNPSHYALEYVPPQPYVHDPIKPHGPYVAAAPYELSSSRAPSTFGGQPTAPPYNANAQPTAVPVPVSQPVADPSISITSEKALPRRAKTIFGCTTLVFVLSCIIALLSMVVIGLAAATGIESHRANTNANKMVALTAQLNSTSQASVEGPVVASGSESKSTSDSGSNSDSGSGTKTVTVSAAVTTETVTVTPTSSISAIDDGCSENPGKVHGSTYTSYKRFNSLKFTRYCQRELEGTVLMVIFTSTFQQCMDACASYSTFIPESFPTGGDKTRCEGLTFVPDWADKAVAGKANSRGNCYLKRGIKGEGVENGKVRVHGAILNK